MLRTALLLTYQARYLGQCLPGVGFSSCLPGAGFSSCLAGVPHGSDLASCLYATPADLLDAGPSLLSRRPRRLYRTCSAIGAPPVSRSRTSPVSRTGLLHVDMLGELP